MSFHSAETGSSLHVLHAFTYANAAARIAATGFASGDVGKAALQSDTGRFYMLTSTAPTWSPISGLDSVHTDSGSLGSLATLSATDIGFAFVRLTGSATSISGITAGTDGQAISVSNQTGSTITLLDNDAGATAANRIRTGSGSSVAMLANSTFVFTYDATAARWLLTGGSGSGGVSAWQASTAYQTNNIVQYAKMLFIATTSFTSAATFEAETAGNWQLVNAPQIQKNYATTGNNIEGTSLSGWQAATVGSYSAGAVPSGSLTIGTGASINLSAQSTGALAGQTSLQNTTASTWTAGQGLISPAFALDPAGQAKSLTVSFNYAATAGAANMNFSGTSSNTYGIYIADMTGGTLRSYIQPAGTYNLVQSVGTGKATATFQSPIDMTSFRILLLVVNPNTSGTTTVLFDEFYVGQVAPVTGPAMTDWQSYTPTGTWTGGNVTYTGRYRRVGDTLECKVGITLTGAPTGAGQVSVNIPSGLVIDTTKMAGTNASTISNVFGTGKTYNASTNVTNMTVTYNSTTSVAIGFEGASTGQLTALTTTTPFTYGNGMSVDIEFMVPIAGWSSNSSMSQDTDNRIVDLSLWGMSNTPSNGTDVLWTTVKRDSHGTFNAGTGEWTVPVSGDYHVDIFGSYTTSGGHSVNQFAGFDVKVDGTVNLGPVKYVENTGVQTFVTTASSIFIGLTAGQKIKVTYDTNLAGTLNASSGARLSIHRLSGSAVVTASETVAAFYTGNPVTGTLNNTFNATTFGTKVKDSHGTMSGNTYTVPVSGTYAIAAGVSMLFTATSSSVSQIQIQRNGSPIVTREFDNFPTQVGGYPTVSIPGYYFNAGDTIKIACFNNATSPTYSSNGADYNYVNIVRTGN